jgi:hypothetical protein
MSTTETNNKPRKSLAEQIDRLDSLLTGLSEAIEGTVADAVQRSVTVAIERAVEGLFTQLVANPAVVELLRGAAAPAMPEGTPPAATPRSSVRERLSGLGSRSRAFGHKVSAGTVALAQRLLPIVRAWLLPLAAVAAGVAGALCCTAGWPLIAAGWAAGLSGRLAKWFGPALCLGPALGSRGCY